MGIRSGRSVKKCSLPTPTNYDLNTSKLCKVCELITVKVPLLQNQAGVVLEDFQKLLRSARQVCSSNEQELPNSSATPQEYHTVRATY